MDQDPENTVSAEFARLFQETDEKNFVGIVSDYLKKGGPSLRHLSPISYVDRCRQLWNECELDQVFNFKILIDTLVQDSEPKKKSPWSGMEVVKDTPISEEDLYCVAIGLVDEKGEFVGAPPEYDPTPNNPRSKRAFGTAVATDVPAEESAEAGPEAYILAMLDVLGFERKLRDIGLGEMHRLYDKLIKVAVSPHVAQNLGEGGLANVGTNLFSPMMFWLPVRFAYFSDTLLFWVPYRPNFVAPFLERCSSVFCEALQLGIPLRGSITAGTCVLHKKSSTYLGDALVEAARLEKAQEWVGVTLGVSVRTIQFPFLMSQEPSVILGEPPLKSPLPNEASDKYKKLVSGLVLDWPRHWREVQGQSPRSALG